MTLTVAAGILILVRAWLIRRRRVAGVLVAGLASLLEQVLLLPDRGIIPT